MSRTPAVDTAVLNSVVNLPRALPFLARHATIHAFLDNDEAGRLTLERLRSALPDATVIDRAESYRSPQGSERIAPIVREGFPHAASSRPQVVTSPGMTPEPSPTHRPLRDRGFSPKEKAIAY